MILADTSAWVEYLRATGSDVNRCLRGALRASVPVAMTEVVAMELLAGARDADHRDRLARLIRSCPFLPLAGLADFEGAAALYRSCRASGSPVRHLTDCLIAIVAIRHRVALLHRDVDFDRLARHSQLRVVDPAGFAPS
ncbi:MAG TPA: PIN domain nuclease [Candidatus Micrarchaeia archaeon]|nr:PIN domain nuclease [Candidatus Micrarchaeia archaeon]